MATHVRRWKRAMAGLATLALGAAAAAETGAIPIPQQPGAQPVRTFIGNPAEPNPIAAPLIPQNPFMAPNGRNNPHDDSYMSDTYVTGGPLGRQPKVFSSLLEGLCIVTNFDHKGRLVTGCSAMEWARLFLLDPDTLATLAELTLPAGLSGNPPPSFYLDHHDRAVIPTVTRQIWVVAVTEDNGAPRFEVERVYDLDAVVPESDLILSALPDFSGRLWFSTRGGLVGAIDPKTGAAKTRRLEGEAVFNTFAVDETGGVFIASDHALYRFDVGRTGEPEVTWRESYDRGTRVKPGQISQGTGTTPTLMGEDYVTITDNADPRMHVLVYRRAAEVKDNRLVCSEPVFTPNRSATDNSVIATDRSIVVENNYGYRSPEATTQGRSTEPGVTRIDLDAGGCHTVWASKERVPSAVPKLSLKSGLVYAYTKPLGPDHTDPWYFTAIDFDSGKTIYKQLAGTGTGYDSAYGGVYLSPDETAYVGTLVGLVAVRDQPGEGADTDGVSAQ